MGLLNNKVPVNVVNGFLESRKSTFIQETLSDPYFSDGGKTLLIACEEGEEDERYYLSHCQKETVGARCASASAVN